MHMYNFLCSDSLLYFFLFLSTLHSVYTRDCSCIIIMFMVQDNIIIILVVISINLCMHVLFYFLLLLDTIMSAESLAKGSCGLDSAQFWRAALLQVLFALYRAEELCFY